MSRNLKSGTADELRDVEEAIYNDKQQELNQTSKLPKHKSEKSRPTGSKRQTASRSFPKTMAAKASVGVKGNVSSLSSQASLLCKPHVLTGDSQSQVTETKSVTSSTGKSTKSSTATTDSNLSPIGPAQASKALTASPAAKPSQSLEQVTKSLSPVVKLVRISTDDFRLRGAQSSSFKSTKTAVAAKASTSQSPKPVQVSPSVAKSNPPSSNSAHLSAVAKKLNSPAVKSSQVSIAAAKSASLPTESIQSLETVTKTTSSAVKSAQSSALTKKSKSPAVGSTKTDTASSVSYSAATKSISTSAAKTKPVTPPVKSAQFSEVPKRSNFPVITSAQVSTSVSLAVGVHSCIGFKKSNSSVAQIKSPPAVPKPTSAADKPKKTILGAPKSNSSTAEPNSITTKPVWSLTATSNSNSSDVACVSNQSHTLIDGGELSPIISTVKQALDVVEHTSIPQKPLSATDGKPTTPKKSASHPGDPKTPAVKGSDMVDNIPHSDEVGAVDSGWEILSQQYSDTSDDEIDFPGNLSDMEVLDEVHSESGEESITAEDGDKNIENSDINQDSRQTFDDAGTHWGNAEDTAKADVSQGVVKDASLCNALLEDISDEEDELLQAEEVTEVEVMENSKSHEGIIGPKESLRDIHDNCLSAEADQSSGIKAVASLNQAGPSITSESGEPHHKKLGESKNNNSDIQKQPSLSVAPVMACSEKQILELPSEVSALHNKETIQKPMTAESEIIKPEIFSVKPAFVCKTEETLLTRSLETLKTSKFSYPKQSKASQTDMPNEFTNLTFSHEKRDALTQTEEQKQMESKDAEGMKQTSNPRHETKVKVETITEIDSEEILQDTPFEASAQPDKSVVIGTLLPKLSAEMKYCGKDCSSTDSGLPSVICEDNATEMWIGTEFKHQRRGTVVGVSLQPLTKEDLIKLIDVLDDIAVDYEIHKISDDSTHRSMCLSLSSEDMITKVLMKVMESKLSAQFLKVGFEYFGQYPHYEASYMIDLYQVHALTSIFSENEDKIDADFFEAAFTNIPLGLPVRFFKFLFPSCARLQCTVNNQTDDEHWDVTLPKENSELRLYFKEEEELDSFLACFTEITVNRTVLSLAYSGKSRKYTHPSQKKQTEFQLSEEDRLKSQLSVCAKKDEPLAGIDSEKCGILPDQMLPAAKTTICMSVTTDTETGLSPEAQREEVKENPLEEIAPVHHEDESEVAGHKELKTAASSTPEDNTKEHQCISLNHEQSSGKDIPTDKPEPVADVKSDSHSSGTKILTEQSSADSECSHTDPHQKESKTKKIGEKKIKPKKPAVQNVRKNSESMENSSAANSEPKHSSSILSPTISALPHTADVKPIHSHTIPSIIGGKTQSGCVASVGSHMAGGQVSIPTSSPVSVVSSVGPLIVPPPACGTRVQPQFINHMNFPLRVGRPSMYTIPPPCPPPRFNSMGEPFSNAFRQQLPGPMYHQPRPPTPGNLPFHALPPPVSTPFNLGTPRSNTMQPGHTKIPELMQQKDKAQSEWETLVEKFTASLSRPRDTGGDKWSQRPQKDSSFKSRSRSRSRERECSSPSSARIKWPRQPHGRVSRPEISRISSYSPPGRSGNCSLSPQRGQQITSGHRRSIDSPPRKRRSSSKSSTPATKRQKLTYSNRETITQEDKKKKKLVKKTFVGDSSKTKGGKEITGKTATSKKSETGKKAIRKKVEKTKLSKKSEVKKHRHHGGNKVELSDKGVSGKSSLVNVFDLDKEASEVLLPDVLKDVIQKVFQEGQEGEIILEKPSSADTLNSSEPAEKELSVKSDQEMQNKSSHTDHDVLTDQKKGQEMKMQPASQRDPSIRNGEKTEFGAVAGEQNSEDQSGEVNKSHLKKGVEESLLKKPTVKSKRSSKTNTESTSKIEDDKFDVKAVEMMGRGSEDCSSEVKQTHAGNLPQDDIQKSSKTYSDNINERVEVVGINKDNSEGTGRHARKSSRDGRQKSSKSDRDNMAKSVSDSMAVEMTSNKKVSDNRVSKEKRVRKFSEDDRQKSCKSDSDKTVIRVSEIKADEMSSNKDIKSHSENRKKHSKKLVQDDNQKSLKLGGDNVTHRSQRAGFESDKAATSSRKSSLEFETTKADRLSSKKCRSTEKDTIDERKSVRNSDTLQSQKTKVKDFIPETDKPYPPVSASSSRIEKNKHSHREVEGKRPVSPVMKETVAKRRNSGSPDVWTSTLSAPKKYRSRSPSLERTLRSLSPDTSKVWTSPLSASKKYRSRSPSRHYAYRLPSPDTSKVWTSPLSASRKYRSRSPNLHQTDRSPSPQTSKVWTSPLSVPKKYRSRSPSLGYTHRSPLPDTSEVWTSPLRIRPLGPGDHMGQQSPQRKQAWSKEANCDLNSSPDRYSRAHRSHDYDEESLTQSSSRKKLISSDSPVRVHDSSRKSRHKRNSLDKTYGSHRKEFSPGSFSPGLTHRSPRLSPSPVRRSWSPKRDRSHSSSGHRSASREKAENLENDVRFSSRHHHNFDGSSQGHTGYQFSADRIETLCSEVTTEEGLKMHPANSQYPPWKERRYRDEHPGGSKQPYNSMSLPSGMPMTVPMLVSYPTLPLPAPSSAKPPPSPPLSKFSEVKKVAKGKRLTTKVSDRGKLGIVTYDSSDNNNTDEEDEYSSVELLKRPSSIQENLATSEADEEYAEWLSDAARRASTDSDFQRKIIEALARKINAASGEKVNRKDNQATQSRAQDSHRNSGQGGYKPDAENTPQKLPEQWQFSETSDNKDYFRETAYQCKTPDFYSNKGDCMPAGKTSLPYDHHVSRPAEAAKNRPTANDISEEKTVNKSMFNDLLKFVNDMHAQSQTETITSKSVLSASPISSPSISSAPQVPESKKSKETDDDDILWMIRKLQREVKPVKIGSSSHPAQTTSSVHNEQAHNQERTPGSLPKNERSSCEENQFQTVRNNVQMENFQQCGSTSLQDQQENQQQSWSSEQMRKQQQREHCNQQDWQGGSLAFRQQQQLNWQVPQQMNNQHQEGPTEPGHFNNEPLFKPQSSTADVKSSEGGYMKMNTSNSSNIFTNSLPFSVSTQTSTSSSVSRQGNMNFREDSSNSSVFETNMLQKTTTSAPVIPGLTPENPLIKGLATLIMINAMNSTSQQRPNLSPSVSMNSFLHNPGGLPQTVAAVQPKQTAADKPLLPPPVPPSCLTWETDHPGNVRPNLGSYPHAEKKPLLSTPPSRSGIMPASSVPLPPQLPRSVPHPHGPAHGDKTCQYDQY